MKNSILIFGILVLALFTTCEKSDNIKADNIIFNQINKTINVSQIDSTFGACRSIVFGVSGNESDGIKAYISYKFDRIVCDAGNQFLVDDKTNLIIALNKNTVVSENGTWKSCTDKLYLDQFAGKGENYIGYRLVAFPEGTQIYYYGWIKIELSSKNETLKILSRADNQTEFNTIKTGQVE